ncbi:hypothetical protein VKT23_017062 [Stygiomarasmius scandens]|uniref:Uncharacterized protein n=1 Tax=Marasmiellus scandens TaxID=2682957 RepID=A0ABR1IVL0_9AGAR
MKPISLVYIVALAYLPHQGYAVTESLPTTLFVYENFYNPAPRTATQELIPVGTASDGSETTFSVSFVLETLAASDGSKITWIQEDIFIVSAAGFKDLYSAKPVITQGITMGGYAGSEECFSIADNKGICSVSVVFDLMTISTSVTVTTNTVGTKLPWEFLIISDEVKGSSFLSNKPAVIGTFTSLGIVVAVIALFLVIKISRRRKSMVEVVTPWETTDSNQGSTSRGIMPFNPKRWHKSSTSFAANNDGQNISVLQPESSTHSVVQPASMLTVRQRHLQEEADDLRTQMHELHHAVNASNEGMQGMQAGMARIMAHIQSLESQQNSDWARGLTDDPPPGYHAGSV